MNTPTPETEALDTELNELDRFEYEGFAPARFRELAEKLERQRDAAREDAERLAQSIQPIVQPLGDETETSGNPCISPHPEQGRAIAKALASHEALKAGN